MLEIYIARHGQNVDNANGILNGHRDEPLTLIGEAQARTVGQEISDAGLHFDAIYASPLMRAFKTAEIIADVSGQPAPQIEPLLIERDFGVMTGVEISRIEELCAPDIIKTDTVTYFLNPKGAETFDQAMERAAVLLAKIRASHDSGRVLFVSHGDFGKMLFASFYGLPWRQVLVDFHFGNSEIVRLAEGADPAASKLFTSTQYNH